MSRVFDVGERVKLVGIPDWLIHDLPDSEKDEIKAFVGRVSVVERIDGSGYYWLGFGSTTEDADAANYSGHSFCVPADFLEPA